jgi:hypothetical protein
VPEQTRAIWFWNWLESLARDLRFGLRTLGRTPGFTVIAILVMALGIGEISIGLEFGLKMMG